MLSDNENVEDIYYRFIITIAMELDRININIGYALSLAMAILDNWFETNKVSTIKMKEELKLEELSKVISDREKLYKEYFSLYNDKYANDIVRVYYSRNGENWIRWDKKCSIDIKVNLSKGIDWGFCRTGFSYSLITSNGDEKFLEVAYVDKDKEIFRFEHANLSSVESNQILWLR